QKSYKFDYVFKPDSTQDQVFKNVASDLVDRFIQGYNVTILAYGQTSSGKTYTMGTAPANELQDREQEVSMIIPPSRRASSSTLSENSKAPRQTVHVSFVEIYNEELIDLLNQAPASERPSVTIREDTKGHIVCTGIKEMAVTSTEDVLKYLQMGTQNRATSATDMNAKSSRSHAIFTVLLKQEKWVPKWVITNSKFHFVDLAGSERLKRTAAQGDRRKEGIHINAGLLALGNVISALSETPKKSLHVPYRDSKLTRLLQDSLGGNATTLMIACVSPTDSNLTETVNTIKYAHRTRSIKNKSERNETE
ncbi:hypothetical protein PHYBLDRAFT_3179, partial [Phycomyces blakesleeanus NRRL 1555(-)]